MLRAAWPIVIAVCSALAACVDDQQAPKSSEPLYTIVFFASDSTTPSKRARDQIADFAANPTGPIKVMPKAKVCVGGHSDRTGPDAVNREVAQRRADAVAKYLVELGVQQERIVTASLGSSKPLVVTGPQTSEISNRRVEIVVGCGGG
jgi:outer membrane protein OmpA-like peptidoglycan-associated protein